jgi:WD40 repeat protein
MGCKKLNSVLSVALLICNSFIAQTPKLVLPVGHIGTVSEAIFSPDGKLILTASQDQTAKVWDTKTGMLLHTLRGHSKKVTSIRFSPDGKYIATASFSDNTCLLWETSTFELLFTFIRKDKLTPEEKQDSVDLGYRSPDIFDIQFNPDNKSIIAAYSDGCFILWNTSTGIEIFKHKLNRESGYEGEEGVNVPVVKFSVTGKRILMGIDTFEPEIWIAGTGFKPFAPGRKQILSNHRGQCADFSPDRKLLVTATSYDDKSNGILYLWDSNGNFLNYIFIGNSHYVSSVSFSPDSKTILVATGNSIKLIDPYLKKNPDSIYSGIKTIPYRFYEFSPDSINKKILVKTREGFAGIFDIKTNTLLVELEGEVENELVHFSPDGTKVVGPSDKNNGKLWDAATGKLLLTLKAASTIQPIHSVIISPADKWILSVMDNGTIRICETASGKLMHSFYAYDPLIPDDYHIPYSPGNLYRFTQFSADEKFIITYQNNDTAKLWETETGKFVCSFSKKGKLIKMADEFKVKFEQDIKAISVTVGNQIYELKLSDMKLVDVDLENTDGDDSTLINNMAAAEKKMPLIKWKSAEIKNFCFDDCFEGQCDAIYLGEIYTAFSHHADWVAIVTGDNTINILNTANAKPVYSLYIFDSADYLVRIPTGYYYSTRDAAKQLYYVTENRQIITFDQLDVRYNRPDKTLQAIGNRDMELISSYQNAYLKRIKKLNIDTLSFSDGYSVPDADIVNRDSISYEQVNESLSLHIYGVDNTYQLDRFNVWVNEVPLYGQRGISIRNNNSNSFNKTVSIKLSPGVNQIDFSVTNANGIESYRKPLLVNYSPASILKSKTYFIGIGINNFKESNNNLKWCVQDIRDLAKALQTKYQSQFVILDTLYNERVTLSAIRSLKQKLQATSINDKVIISYSGHGLLSKDFDYYLSSYTTNFSKPEEGGIAYDEFENLLDSIPARKKILFLDACNSGEVDKEELKKINNSSAALAEKNITVTAGNKGGDVEISADENAKLGIQNSFELMQTLFVNVGKGTGATIISASGGVQFAQERSELGHGVFTYSLIEAIQHFKTMKISALKKYVGDRVTELTNGLQKPTTRNELIASDWDVW